MIQNIAKIFTNPLLYLWIALLVSLYKSKGNRKRLIILNIMFYCLCSYCIGLALSAVWKVNDSYNKDVTYDAAIILAPVLRKGEFKSIGDTDYDFRVFLTSNRLLTGIGFVRSGHSKSLLIGNNANVKGYNVGSVIRKFAEYQGLKEDEIRIYGDVWRTLDEVNGVKEFLDENEYKNVILVTSEMHMRRALAMFNKVGIFPDTYSVNKSFYKTKGKYLIPTVRGAKKVQEFFHELFGYVGYYLKGDI
jgi:uncharacterized SAM-binding protein YcdF (DUF218 family)